MAQIYKITCKATRKSYIGKTKHKFESRYSGGAYWRETHSRELSDDCFKYGENQMTVEILFEMSVVPDNILNALEKILILDHKTIQPHGYNKLLGCTDNVSERFASVFLYFSKKSADSKVIEQENGRLKEVIVGLKNELNDKREYEQSLSFENLKNKAAHEIERQNSLRLASILHEIQSIEIGLISKFVNSFDSPEKILEASRFINAIFIDHEVRKGTLLKDSDLGRGDREKINDISRDFSHRLLKEGIKKYDEKLRRHSDLNDEIIRLVGHLVDQG